MSHLGNIDIPSSDTILRGDKELSVPCQYINTNSPKGNKINVNSKMNEFLIESAIKFEQLNPPKKKI